MDEPALSVGEGYTLAGKYRLSSLLGRGGMGAVWRAEHLGLRAPVAVKLMNSLIAGNPEALGRFHREAHAAAALRSQHVVQVLDYGIDEPSQTPFIVMELLEGESLGSRLKRVGVLSVAGVARIIPPVCRALSRAHELGIVHRDLKPDNIFLVREDDHEIVKVLDFGIAKAQAYAVEHDSTTQTGAVLGTPHYMSPEQIRGSKDIDFRSDLWTVGVIACECLVGKRVFGPGPVGELALAICAHPLPVPSSLGPVPAGFDEWFARALARDPSQRFPSARVLADELQRVCQDGGAFLESRASHAELRPLESKVVGSPSASAQTAERQSDTVNATSNTSPETVPKRRRGLSMWLLSGVGAAALLVLLLTGLLLSRRAAQSRTPADADAHEALPTSQAASGTAAKLEPRVSADVPAQRADDFAEAGAAPVIAPAADGGTASVVESAKPPPRKAAPAKAPSPRSKGDTSFSTRGVLDQRR